MDYIPQLFKENVYYLLKSIIKVFRYYILITRIIIYNCDFKMLPWPNVMYAQPMDTQKLDGCSRQDKAFHYSLNGQAFKNMFIICVLFMKQSFEYSVLEGVTTSRRWGHANFLGQWFPSCRLALSQPGIPAHCLSKGCCIGALLISQGSRSQLHSTNHLFNGWRHGAGLKESCQLCSCLWDTA